MGGQKNKARHHFWRNPTVRLTPRRAIAIVAACAAAGLLAIGSCTDSSSKVQGVTPPDSPLFAKGGPTGVQRVNVSPSTSTRDIGQTVQLTATAVDKKNNVISGVVFTWSSN